MRSPAVKSCGSVTTHILSHKTHTLGNQPAREPLLSIDARGELYAKQIRMCWLIRLAPFGIVQRGLDVGRRRVNRKQRVSRRHCAVYASRYYSGLVVSHRRWVLSDLPDPEYPVCDLYFPTLSLSNKSGGGGEWGFGDFSGSVHIKEVDSYGRHPHTRSMIRACNPLISCIINQLYTQLQVRYHAGPTTADPTVAVPSGHAFVSRQASTFASITHPQA